MTVSSSLYVPLAATIILLIVFQVKHFIADYPLQGEYMLGKFRPGWDFVHPLLAHVGVHMAFTYWIVLLCTWDFTLAVCLSFLDGGVHFVMDRIKAGPKYLGRFKAISGDDYRNLKHLADMQGDHPEIVSAARFAQGRLDEKMRSNRLFWWSLGLDQMVHHLTHYVIIYFILTAH